MGLGAPKRRTKLSRDPNNTAWTRSTTSYGHKILSAQGWTPGSYLGAEDAAHADHYTSANASHIRVLLREDNLGLGAKVGGSRAETFGLSLFSGVLGRLNGKDEGELKKEEDARRDVELRTYQERKFGVVGFVRGGYLVGDRVVESLKDEESDGDAGVKDRRKSKKRKVDDDVSTEETAMKKPKGIEEEAPVVKSEPMSEDDATVPIQARKEKKHKDKGRKKSKSEPPTTSDIGTSADSNTEDLAIRRNAKEEKRARKEDRRKRKEEKAKRKAERTSRTASGESTPTTVTAPTSGQSTPTLLSMGGRQAVRHRYIQQKRMASMDAQAMKEIFMMKAAG